MVFDVDSFSGSIDNTAIVEHMFNVHSVMILSLTTKETIKNTDVLSASGRKWEILSSNSVSTSDGRKYSFYCAPLGVTNIIQKQFVDTKGLASAQTLMQEKPWNVNVPIKVPILNISLAALLMRARSQEFEKQATAEGLYSRKNILLYTTGVNLLSCTYADIVANVDAKSRENLTKVGSNISYNDRTKLNLYLGEGSFPEKKRSYSLHVETLFDQIVTIKGAYNLPVFKTYKMDFADKAIPSTNYVLYKVIYQPRITPEFTYFFGVS